MYRYTLRGTETEEQILKRLRNAEAEIKQGESSGIFDHFLFNDNLEECYESLKVMKFLLLVYVLAIRLLILLIS